MPLEFSCDYITLVIFTFHKENFHKKEIPQLDRVFQAFWKYLNININITYFCVLLWNLFWNLETSLHTMWNNIFYSLNKNLWLEKKLGFDYLYIGFGMIFITTIHTKFWTFYHEHLGIISRGNTSYVEIYFKIP